MNKRSSIWHFLSRLAGLTGLLALVVGLVARYSLEEESFGELFLYIGGALLALAVLVEAKGLARLGSSRRGAVGLTVLFQVLLAVTLLVGVNWFSFEHWRRYDWTREHFFTINDDLRTQLAKLTGETDIIVYQMHVTFGQTKGDSDSYDAAAERKIVEKVKDLAEQFAEFGPRFHVQNLDKQELSFPDKLDEIRKHSKELAAAIEAAPENSIFFHSKNKDGLASVQRLAFHNIYQLNRKESLENNDKKGNLVLSYQGLGPFARKILNVEEKKPRIAVATINPLLGMNDDDAEQLCWVGARKALESQGFVTRDILLREGEPGELGPFAVYTYEENAFDFNSEMQTLLEKEIPPLRQELDTLNRLYVDFKSDPLEKLNEKYIYVKNPGEVGFRLEKMASYLELKKSKPRLNTSHIDKDDREQETRELEMLTTVFKLRLDQMTSELDKARSKLKDLKADDLEEKRRISDIRLKMNRVLADCDLLVIPRTTLLDATRPREALIRNELHALHPGQLAALQSFLKAGKPVLFCLGPANVPGARIPEDDLEKALKELGFELPPQTVLYTSEIPAFSQIKANIRIPGSTTKVDVPPPLVDWSKGPSLAGKMSPLSVTLEKEKVDSPLVGSLRLYYGSLSVNKEMTEEFARKMRHPRPVFFVKQRLDPARICSMIGGLTTSVGLMDFPYTYKQVIQPRFIEKNTLLASHPSGWNEDMPFTTKERSPQPTRAKDPLSGTLFERRQGPLPIAAAAEVEVPESWFYVDQVPTIVGLTMGGFALPGAVCALASFAEKKATARVVVIGSGTVFNGKNLNPLQQKLLLDTCNWLLGREDLLARDQDTWLYPRVHFTEFSFKVWQWSTRLGMPLIFIFLGTAMWMVRRMR